MCSVQCPVWPVEARSGVMDKGNGWEWYTYIHTYIHSLGGPVIGDSPPLITLVSFFSGVLYKKAGLSTKLD